MAFSKARRLANLMSAASDNVPAAKVNTVLADDAVTSPKIADDAVTTDKLANSINSAITANTAKVTNATHTGDVTGGAALTIAVDAVDIPMLSASGSPSSTTFLRGDNAWAAPGGVDVQSSAPSVAAEGSLYYNTTSNLLYASDGTAWQVVGNLPPETTGGTVTITSQAGYSTFTYNLGLNFTDTDTADGSLAYTLASGTLPGGAVLPSSGNSAFTGTATNPGGSSITYNFVIKATDTNGASNTQAYTQVISPGFQATGGTITNSGGYRIHTFTSSGNFVVPAGINNTTARYLIIAGGAGGGAGYYGGGGGAGGYRTNFGTTGGGGSTEASITLAASTTYAITVGAGGAGQSAGTSGGRTDRSANGSNSVLATLNLTSIGGGGAGCYYNNDATTAGAAGGSGGGAGRGNTALSWRTSNNMVGGGRTSGQGNVGGNCYGYSAPYCAGGGGGAGGAGQHGDGGASNQGDGGLGITSSISGSAVARGGGGGAGADTSGFRGVGVAGGGSGTSHAGAQANTQAAAGTANTGGGGGGTGSGGTNSVNAGPNGGSGVVIISYPE